MSAPTSLFAVPMRPAIVAFALGISTVPVSAGAAVALKVLLMIFASVDIGAALAVPHSVAGAWRRSAEGLWNLRWSPA